MGLSVRTLDTLIVSLFALVRKRAMNDSDFWRDLADEFGLFQIQRSFSARTGSESKASRLVGLF